MAVGMAIARQAVGGFNPLSLPGLHWLLHPEDASGGQIIAGEINACTDRKAAKTFSAAAAANRMARNTTDVVGKVRADTNALLADWLAVNDATFAQGIGSAGFTLFSYQRFENTANSKSCLSYGNTNTTADSGNRRIVLGQNSSAAVLTMQDAVGTTVYSWGAGDGYTASSSYETWIVTLTSGGNATMYIDGASKGLKAGTFRDPAASLTHVKFGGGGNAGAPGHHGPKGACVGVLSAANISALHTWLAAS